MAVVAILRVKAVRQARVSRRLFLGLQRQLAGERAGPPTVSSWMYFHPDAVLPLVQFERARPSRYSEVPVTAAGKTGHRALAPHHEPTPVTFLESLARSQGEIKFEHCR